MAEILKPPRPALVRARYKDNCGATILFEPSDVVVGDRDGDYVVCPACKEWIDASLLRWKKIVPPGPSGAVRRPPIPVGR